MDAPREAPEGRDCGESTDDLFRLAYDELRGLARTIAGDRGETLQPTALVHDVFLKLEGGGRAWDGRRHFLAVAAKAMRQVLRDHAKAKGAVKRGAGRRDVTLNEELVPGAGPDIDALALDEALTSLARHQPDAARVAELRILAGMGTDDVAATLGCSPRKVQLDWRAARAWLTTRLAADESEGA